MVWPVFERPMLLAMSRHLFSERTSLLPVLTDIKSWLYPGIWLSLTLHRFSPSRSFVACDITGAFARGVIIVNASIYC